MSPANEPARDAIFLGGFRIGNLRRAAGVGLGQTKIARSLAEPPFVAATTFGNWLNLSRFLRQSDPLGDVLVALKRPSMTNVS